jgi:N-acetylmuramoyl-L-alanine amidase
VQLLVVLALAAGIGGMVWQLKRPAARVEAGPPVVIDAGHGGGDGGTQVFGLVEKELTLDLALRLAAALEARGVPVVLTRRNDANLPLEDRVAIAVAHPGAVFLSLHFNRFESPTVRGVEAYVSSPDEAVEVRLEPGDAPRQYRDRRSAELGARLAEAAAAAVGMPSRGVREAGFHVTRHAPAPAVLLECGFLSNPEDARLAAKPAYRQKMAEALAEALAAYAAERRRNRLLGFAQWSSGPRPAGEGEVIGPDGQH